MIGCSGSTWPAEYFWGKERELSSQAFKHGCLEVFVSSARSKSASISACLLKPTCVSPCCLICSIASVCKLVRGASSKQALATPETNANTQTSNVANALIRLMRMLKKFSMLILETSYYFMRTRLKSIDANQTLNNCRVQIPHLPHGIGRITYFSRFARPKVLPYFFICMPGSPIFMPESPRLAKNLSNIAISFF